MSDTCPKVRERQLKSGRTLLRDRTISSQPDDPSRERQTPDAATACRMRSAAAVGDSLKCALDTEYMAYSKNSIRILTAKYRTESSAAEGFPSQAISAKTLLVSQQRNVPNRPKNPRASRVF
ncbi:uncharacterized protein AKAW2_11576A [Aspergillus luchuensis]|uniref:Uncharacterized protein n=1 Tax=Aspergillus kawachii TaxID=1069201 RepID=A0A7R7W1D2_ASPKA|nr:uncharacterized protein AKAW2_11576A [Aspergillus luchuensis]BCR94530.1 hypothetical protein AKAW2_11576A [Aspergillus luchuensis]